jgi:hypothetical protein
MEDGKNKGANKSWPHEPSEERSPSYINLSSSDFDPRKRTASRLPLVAVGLSLL